MKFVVAATCAAMIGLGVPASALAQSAPELNETLSFIRDQIAQQGQVNFATSNRDPATGQSWVNQTSQEGSNLSVDVDECKLNLHWHTTSNGKVDFDGDGWIPFRQVDHVTVVSLDDYFAGVNAANGHSAWTTQASPPMTVVTSVRSDGVENIFYFQDSDLANRVAQAMRHATELCGATGQ